MRRARALLLTLGALAAPAAAAQPLTFGEALAGRRPSPEQLDADGLLAEARREAAGGASAVAEAPSVAALAGPRRGEDATATDVAVAVEVPLLAGRGARGLLAAEVEAAAAPLAAGARAVAAADLASAFVDVWLAQATAAVRAQDLAASEEWLVVARRRVEAGADPPYEPTLVAGERDRSLLELVAARRAIEAAWGELAARSEVGPAPRPVTLDGLPGAAGQPPAGPGAAAAGIDVRERLVVALGRVRGAAAASRWSLQGEVASEGDERLAHVGVAYRLPLRGERAAIAQERAAAEEQARRLAERERATLRARLAAADAALATPPPALGPDDLDRAHRALAARLDEGKERPSEILPLRRQLLEARLATLAAAAAARRAAAEAHYLRGGAGDAP